MGIVWYLNEELGGGCHLQQDGRAGLWFQLRTTIQAGSLQGHDLNARGPGCLI